MKTELKLILEKKIEEALDKIHAMPDWESDAPYWPEKGLETIVLAAELAFDTIVETSRDVQNNAG